MNYETKADHHAKELKHYLLILEDGSLFKYIGDCPPPGSIEAADTGVIDLIDISDRFNPMQYVDEGWTDVDNAVEHTE